MGTYINLLFVFGRGERKLTRRADILAMRSNHSAQREVMHRDNQFAQ